MCHGLCNLCLFRRVSRRMLEEDLILPCAYLALADVSRVEWSLC